LGIIYSETFGSAGMGYIEYEFIVEEISAVDPSIGLIVTAYNALVTWYIYQFADENQRKKYILRLVIGTTLST